MAVLGAPNDMGTGQALGARFGPRAIREASTLFSFGHSGAYDFEDDILYLTKEDSPDRRRRRRGHRPHRHGQEQPQHRAAVRKMLEQGAFPLVLGGDHSIYAPVIAAFEGKGPIHILHIDAHLDFVDERHGVRATPR